MPYIDTKYLGKCETCRHHSNSGCNTYCDHGEEYSPNLSKIPTADVVEVKHGEWIKKPFISGLLKRAVKNEFVFTCSVCGFDSICVSDYCRNCGAKMDGGADNGNTLEK